MFLLYRTYNTNYIYIVSKYETEHAIRTSVVLTTTKTIIMID